MGSRIFKPLAIMAASLVLVLVLGLTSGAVFAGANSACKVAIHVKAHPTSCTKGFPTFTDCSSILTTYAAGGDIDALPVFYNLTGYIVTEVGMIWPEATWGSGSWTKCKGDLAIGSIQHSADAVGQDSTTMGVIIAWSACQNTFSVAPGLVWLAATEPGRVVPTHSGNGGAWGVVDCAPDPGPYYDVPSGAFGAGVFGAVGDDPCATLSCDISPSSLNFGTVNTGTTQDMIFVLTNTGSAGGGNLGGVVKITSGDNAFTLVGGDRYYDLAVGEPDTITVRFAPTTLGPLSCTIATGAVCGDVTCTGVGDSPPACAISPEALHFGTVLVGDSLDKTFTITNTAGGTLSGTVSESCPDYSVVSGSPYSLTASQQAIITIRFKPNSEGLKSCTIETGAAECVDVACDGTGLQAAACEVNPTTLDFGTVTTGGNADRTFTIKNSGGGTLAGDVTESCADYSIVSGTPYSLAAGESVTVTVRFAPVTAGTKLCTVNPGTSCATVSCTGVGDLPAACEVNPTTLDFGTVTTGGNADRTFTIKNSGGGTLAGDVTESCADYSIVSGTPYSLAAGESVTVTVRFAPATAGTKLCTVNPGTSCATVSCTGVGDLPAACEVNPTTLDFGTVTTGGNADRTFTIKNSGGGTLAGDVTESCADYSIVSGTPYSLAAGESVTVTVRFAPATAGTKLCTVNPGTSCATVACTGVGDLPAACEVNPTTLDFGTVTTGGNADRTFTIKNSGGGTLAGDVTESCADYSIVSGTPYSLAAGESVTVTVRFAPATAGTKLCTVNPGTSCATVACTGVGQSPTACQVNPTSLDFGTVTTGGNADRTFTIKNTGGGTLAGDVTESCADYSIVSGTPYSLAAGESVTVTVRFAPATAGTKLCTVNPGTSCATVACTGVGDLPAACEVNPTTLDFGTVTTGGNADRTFTIKNTGGGTLAGDVTESCADYSVVSGTPYSLAAGESVTVTVRFAPVTAGTKLCTVNPGTSCATVACAGVGEEVPPVCQVNPTSLDFGTVTTGGNADRTFTIKNTGGGTLAGDVTESCADYSIVSGTPYSLAAGESVTVTVRFAPVTAGTKLCTVNPGTSCATVACAGVGEEVPPVCQVNPTSLDFGTVTTGGNADRTFTIKNTGGGTLAGDVTESCADYSIVSGTPYSLAAGESVTVTVRFAPSTPGLKDCTIGTGTSCATVSCTGVGDLPAACEVDPTTLDFGTVTTGSTVDRTFTITNTGGGTLAGSVTESCGDYSIVSGTPYSLTGGQSVTVTVRFAPATAGTKLCTVNPGTSCATVACTGVGEEAPPVCQVNPTTLDFGTVTIGNSLDKTFTIKNTGGGTLAGDVTESCADYSVVSGTPYSLATGESVTVTVRFAPVTAGTKLCTVNPGTSCATVACTGVGESSGVVKVYVDIKPGECPNLVNPKANGVLPVAILGTADFDVRNIDVSSIRLSREGTSGSVAPTKWNYGKITSPYLGDPCGCLAAGFDSYADLGLKFSVPELVTALDLGAVKGETIELVLTGMLTSGVPIRGSDCIFVLGKKDRDDHGNGHQGGLGLSAGAAGFEFGDQVGVLSTSQMDVAFYASSAGHVRIDVFDVHGRLVANLLDSDVTAGSHSAVWTFTGGSGGQVPVGIYFVRMVAATNQETKKVVVVE